MADLEERLDVGGLGAFVDTRGSTKRQKRRKKQLSEASDDTAPSPGVPGARDEVEARLESMVFGTQPFQAGQPDSDLRDTTSDEVISGRCRQYPYYYCVSMAYVTRRVRAKEK